MSIKLKSYVPEVEVESNQEGILLTAAKDTDKEQIVNSDFPVFLKEIVNLVSAHKSFVVDVNESGEATISVKGAINTEEPAKISVGEAAEILGISPQLVRRYCKEGKLNGTQTLGNSGKWTIFVDEKITNGPEWSNYKERIELQKENSKQVANTLLTIINEKDSDN